MSLESGGQSHKVADSFKQLGSRTVEYVEKVARRYVEKTAFADNVESISRIVDNADRYVRETEEGLELTSLGRLERDIFTVDHLGSFGELVETYMALTYWEDDDHDTYEPVTDKQRFLLSEMRKDLLPDLASWVEEDFLEQEEERIRSGQKTRLKYDKDTVRSVKSGKILPPQDSKRIVASLVKESWNNAAQNKVGRGALTEPDYLQRETNESEDNFKERVYLRYAVEHARIGREPDAKLEDKVAERIVTKKFTALTTILVAGIVAFGYYAYKDKIDELYPILVQPASQETQDNVLQALGEIQVPAQGTAERSVVEIAPGTFSQPGLLRIQPSENAPVLRTETFTPTTTMQADGDVTSIITGTVEQDPSSQVIIVQETDAQTGQTTTSGRIDTADSTYVLGSVPNKPGVLGVETVPSENQVDLEVNENVALPPVPPLENPGPSVQSSDPTDSIMTEYGATAGNLVDVEGWMTDAAIQQNPNLVLDIRVAIEAANSSFAKSQTIGRVRPLDNLPLKQVAPVLAAQIDESKMQLDKIRTLMGESEEIWAQRQRDGADVGFLVVADNGQCGTAFIRGKGYDNSGFRRWGLFVVTASCMRGNLSWQHEFAHTLGLDHQWLKRSVDALIRDDGRGLVDGNVNSIPAYSENGSRRIDQFTNVAVPTYEGRIFGKPGVSDEVATLDKTFPIAASDMPRVRPITVQRTYSTFIPYATR